MAEPKKYCSAAERSRMIQFEQVSFSYGKQSIIKNVNFTINKGDFVAIIGANGAGKSTISKLMNGLLKPTLGTVTIAGYDTKRTRTSILVKHVGFLFQNPDRQICQNTVRDEIMFGIRLFSKEQDRSARRVDAIMKKFHLRADKSPFSLSRGERQKVALASLIAVEPEILILDEPTTGLDHRECMQMMECIREMNKKGVTVVMVCHDMEVVKNFASRILVISGGELIADDTEMRR